MQQQCRSNIVECYKLNDSFDKVECCFDIVAVFLQQCGRFRQQCRTKFRPFDKLETNWTCSICFDFVERTKFYIESFDIVAVCGNKVDRSFDTVALRGRCVSTVKIIYWLDRNTVCYWYKMLNPAVQAVYDFFRNCVVSHWSFKRFPADVAAAPRRRCSVVNLISFSTTARLCQMITLIFDSMHIGLQIISVSFVNRLYHFSGYVIFFSLFVCPVF